MAKHGRYIMYPLTFEEESRFLLQITRPRYSILGVNVRKKTFTVQHYEGAYATVPEDLKRHIKGYVTSFRRAYGKYIKA